MTVRYPHSERKRLSNINPRTVTYVLSDVDFGAGDTAHAIKAPAGYTEGRIIDVGVAVSEVFNQVTTPGYVRLGTAADADAYAELNMAAAAATNFYNTQDDTDAIINAQVSSTQIEVACIAPTGGTETGIGDVHIVIDWF